MVKGEGRREVGLARPMLNREEIEESIFAQHKRGNLM